MAANEVVAMKNLTEKENVTLDEPKLRRLAKLLDHREVWSYVTSLQSLAWEKLQQSFPAVRWECPDTLWIRSTKKIMMRRSLMISSNLDSDEMISDDED